MVSVVLSRGGNADYDKYLHSTYNICLICCVHSIWNLDHHHSITGDSENKDAEVR